MPQHVSLTQTLVAAGFALCLGLALPATAATTFIVFHSPSGNGDAAGTKPSVLPLTIPVGGSASVRAFLENYDPLGPGSADPALVCVSSPSNHVCGWKVSFVGTGIRIDGFSAAVEPPSPIESKLGSDGSRLDVVGGSVNGESGAIEIGVLQVTALASSGTLVAQGNFLDAAGASRTPAPSVVAVTLDTCGNAVRDTPPEQCDDGNSAGGDGCFPSCRLESKLTLSGVAQGGALTLEFLERTAPLAILTIPGESGAALAGRVTTVLNEDASLDAAGRSALNPTAGMVATDASGESASSSDPGIQVFFIPEPGGLAPLLAGLLLLWPLARRRRERPRS
jgi:cysteine-rich repeat protein